MRQPARAIGPGDEGIDLPVLHARRAEDRIERIVETPGIQDFGADRSRFFERLDAGRETDGFRAIDGIHELRTGALVPVHLSAVWARLERHRTVVAAVRQW